MTEFLLVGLGFISSGVAEHLSRRHNVTITYRSLNPVKSKYVQKLVGKANVLRADPLELAPLVEKSDVVVNFVGEVSGEESSLRIANVEVPRTLARMTRGKTFVHLSGATLGQTERVVREEETHGVGLSPSTSFERTKLEGESEVLRENPNSVVLRPTLVYGTNSAHIQFVTMYKLVKRGLVPRLSISYMPVSVTYIGRAIEIIAESRPQRSYMYATECEPVSINDFFSAFASGLNVKYFSLPFPTEVAKIFLPREIRSLLRYSGVRFSCESMRRLVGDLRFRSEELEENARFLRQLDAEGILIPT
ncbi:hypothetical protein HS1genome_1288 [Sulfodiicoccus acidiphilus]|uniref:NAD-dependent epimerase/dehydratase domain-containing protein n=1 Tax=Sulfodiicoccus acidiphilus TaxID=1670455 RepID=A0A348B3Z7_9CREN|nr:NAD-dependent epimerase/dehydratase family protein [Sulfodiicoccus acidiphilus]BBD72899.1 hypothetical protein HS1genome_1288 [Sulfodiicoccus acidiphilus]GGT88155.1 hypothetical protein GCM10007116_02640 [Sulfodiicoccus acidiphilus]